MDLKLDVYEPTARPGSSVTVPHKKPAYVMMHGGGNSKGSKGGLNIAPAHWWASRGFVVFDIDYRLLHDQGLLPAEGDDVGLKSGWRPFWASAYPATRDAKAAIRFVRAQAGKYGVDVSRVASTGGSAGATDMFASGVSFEPDFKDELTVEEDPTLQSTNMNMSSSVQCLVLHWPSDQSVGLIEQHYPAPGHRYRPSNPPAVSFHGDKDTTIPIQHSENIKAAYAKTGVEFQLNVLKGCPHGSWCYDGKGRCTCGGGGGGGERSMLMDEMAFPAVTRALNLTVVGASDMLIV